MYNCQPLPRENSHETLPLLPKGPDPVIGDLRWSEHTRLGSQLRRSGETWTPCCLPTQGDGSQPLCAMGQPEFSNLDKNGAALFGPAAGNTLWQNAVGQDACRDFNGGDPITLYDHQADRWLMSQLAFQPALQSFPNGPFYQCHCRLHQRRSHEEVISSTSSSSRC